MDAPVSGGVLAANAGTLTFMVGADEPADFEKAKALLLDMGKNVTHCGKVGSGGAVKICNNSKLSEINSENNFVLAIIFLFKLEFVNEFLITVFSVTSNLNDRSLRNNELRNKLRSGSKTSHIYLVVCNWSLLVG